MKLSILLCFLFLSFFSFSQNKSVTVITTANETIYGTIDDKEWLSNPSVIRIKKTGSASFEQYKPAQVKSIRVKDGDYYESYLIKIDNTPTEFEGAYLDSTEIASVEKHAFLLVQFSAADLSLYSYRSKNQLRFYLKQKNEVPQELIYRKYTVRRSNGIFEQEDNKYIDQLSFLAENCSENDKKLNSLPYKLSDIIDLLKSYYKNCHNSSISYVHTQPGKGRFSASVLGGISKTVLTFKSTNPDAVHIGVITRTPLKADMTVAPGLRFGYLIPRAHQKFSLLLDLYYNSFTAFTFGYNYNNAPNDYETKSLSIRAAYLHSSLGLRVFLTRESNFRPFLLAGITQSFMLSHTAEATYEKNHFGTTTITTEYPFPHESLKKAAFGEYLGIGLSYKKLGVDIRMHNLGSLARFTAIKSPMHATSLFVSYQLTR